MVTTPYFRPMDDDEPSNASSHTLTETASTLSNYLAAAKNEMTEEKRGMLREIEASLNNFFN